MAVKSVIGGRKVNHSGRKTTETTLLHDNVPPTDIIQLTGHKNVNGINNYATPPIEQHY